MNTSEIIKKLNEFDNLQDEEKLHSLDTLLQNLPANTLGPEVYRALFQILERFPESDGFGMFWSILHLLEKCENYEPFLVESVNRIPCEFNLNMVNRIINSGVTSVAGVDLISLLEAVSKNVRVAESARHWALSFIEYQRQKIGK